MTGPAPAPAPPPEPDAIIAAVPLPPAPAPPAGHAAPPELPSDILGDFLAAVPVSLATYDLDGRLTYVRPGSGAPALPALAGTPGVRVAELWPVPDLEVVMRRVLAGETVTITTEIAGRVWDVEHRPRRDDTGRVVGGLAVAVDATERARAQEELRQAEARWRALAQLATDLAMLADGAGHITWTSPAIEGLFGYTAEDVVGHLGFDFIHPHDLERVHGFWRRVIAQPRVRHVVEFRVRDAAGDWRWAEEHATNLLDEPDVGAVAVNLRDVHARKQTEREMARAALYDPLTGLPRLPLLRDRLARAVDTADADGDDGLTALVQADLLDFTAYNARRGHDEGDLALVQVAEALVAAVGPRDTVARVGGDGFAVLRERVSSTAEALHLGEHVRAAVRGLAGPGLDVAVGVAAARPPYPDDLLVAAGDALAEAQTADGPRVVLHDPSSAGARRGGLVAELRAGIPSGQLRVHVQPVLGLVDGAVRGVEALVRWQHPVRGLLEPEHFLAAAEECGLVEELGAKVLRTACAWAAPRSVGYVSVNVSGRQLTGGRLPTLVAEVLAATGLAADRLLLEVTETSLIEDLDAGVEVLSRLRALGVRLAIDDFGTGWSSLLYLKRLPVDKIKIDREFVAGIADGGDDLAIVASVVSLARTTGVRCIAEGVETAEQLQALRELGCDGAQGHLWSPAVPLDEADALLARLAAATGPGTAVPGDGDVAGRRRRRPPTPEAAEDVAEILRLHAGGASLHTIAAALNVADRRTAKGARWHPNSVARVVAGAAYPSLSH